MKVVLAISALLITDGFATPLIANPLQADPLQKDEDACTAGDTQVCQRLGAAYRLGLRNTSIDLTKARAAYARGCKPDDWRTGTSCAELFKMVSLGEGGPKDPAKAASLRPKACGSGIVAQQVYLESVGLCK